MSVHPNRSLKKHIFLKLLFASFAVIVLSPPPARAMVTEPSGLTAPNPVSAQETADSGGRELHLDKLFMSLGETFNYQTDGLTKPSQFSPTCSFAGKMLLRGGGCRMDFGWYNVDPARTGPPADADIHTLIPATSTNAPWFPAVGDTIPANLTFNADNIRNDAAYKGGLIGFALRKSGAPCTETHYSEPELNEKCTNCTPVAPWIAAVIWKSKLQDTYYIGFEDSAFGNTKASAASMDGDFNDFVYVVSGISCDGGGAKCDTGMPGICKDGLQECVTGGTLMCKPNLKPKTEECNGLDDDCNGMTDDNAVCPAKKICDRGVCVPPCSMTEFPCSPGYTCVRQVCVENACANVTCPDGQICKGGACKAPCDGVTCPKSQVCRVGRCVDPCEGVTCASDRVCSGGVCIPSCKCRSCDAGKACLASGACVDSGCANKTCAAGEVCEAGSCVDACTGATCPSGQECKVGKCEDMPKPDGGVVTPTAGTTGTAGTGGTGGDTSLGGSGGGGQGGSAGTTAAGGGGTTTVDAGTAGAGGDTVPREKISASSGCRCDAGGSTGGVLTAVVVLSCALLLASARRRRPARVMVRRKRPS
jgi:hypothetical protein